MSAKIAHCTICTKPLTPETTIIDEQGRPVHNSCYSFITRMRGSRKATVKVIRCPYCVDGSSFKEMTSRADGEWFICSSCGHAKMPGQPAYRCNCAKCQTLT
jgi:hypothetical protein